MSLSRGRACRAFLDTVTFAGCHFPERVFGVKWLLAFFGDVPRSWKRGAASSNRDASLCRRIRVGRRVVTVFVFEVVEPFFSVAAAPQHIPSWIRLPITAGTPPAAAPERTARQAGTEYSAATVSRTHGRLNQLDARLAAESKWHIRLALCREGL